MCRSYNGIMFVFFFFFSSRRRHTRLQGDWSSDVCSSDLGRSGPGFSGTSASCASIPRRRGILPTNTGRSRFAAARPWATSRDWCTRIWSAHFDTHASGVNPDSKDSRSGTSIASRMATSSSCTRKARCSVRCCVYKKSHVGIDKRERRPALQSRLTRPPQKARKHLSSCEAPHRRHLGTIPGSLAILSSLAAAAAVALEVATKHRSLTQRAHRRSPRADSALDAPIQCARQSVVIRRRNRPEYAILLAVRACGEEKRVRAGVPAATQRHSPKAVDRDRFAV